MFRCLGTRVKNKKVWRGDCLAHVQEQTVVHDIEHLQTRSSFLSLSLISGAEERKGLGTYGSSEIKRVVLDVLSLVLIFPSNPDALVQNLLSQR